MPSTLLSLVGKKAFNAGIKELSRDRGLILQINGAIRFDSLPKQCLRVSRSGHAKGDAIQTDIGAYGTAALTVTGLEGKTPVGGGLAPAQAAETL